MKVGRIKAKKVGGDFGYSSKGGEQVAVLFETIDGETITWYGHFTEKTAETTFKTLALLGVSNDLANINEPSDIEVTLVIVEEADNEGTMQFKVRWVNGGDGVALAKRMDPGQRAAFAKKIAGSLEIARKSLGKNVAPPRAHVPQEEFSDADNEIPF